MQSTCSACLFFHLKLPKLLRCQRVPPQTFQGSWSAGSPSRGGLPEFGTRGELHLEGRTLTQG